MTEAELKTEIRKRALSGAYFFYGEEDYMKNHYAGEFRRTLVTDEALAAFNCFLFHDENAQPERILEAALAPALGADRKFIDVSVSTGEIFANRDALEQLLQAASDAPDVTLLLRVSADGFQAGTKKKPSALLKRIEQRAKCVNFEYQDAAKLSRWLARHAEDYGVSLPPKEALSLIQRAGRSMYRLQGEIEKVAAYAAAHGKNVVTEEILDVAASKTDEEDAFRLANCILNGDQQSALRCLSEKIRRREEPHLILAQISRTFCDLAAAAHFAAEGYSAAEFAKAMNMHAYRAELYYRSARGVPQAVFDQAVSDCMEADRQLKTSPLGYVAVERLVCSRR